MWGWLVRRLASTTTPRSHCRPAACASVVLARRPMALSTRSASRLWPLASVTSMALAAAWLTAATVVQKCHCTPKPVRAAWSSALAWAGSSAAIGADAGSTSCTGCPVPARSLANSQPISPAPMISTRALAASGARSASSRAWKAAKSSRLFTDNTCSAASPANDRRIAWAPVASTRSR